MRTINGCEPRYGDEYVVTTFERALTEKELDSCRPDNPRSESVTVDIGSPVCGDTVVKTQTTTTNFTFEYNAETKTWDKVETGTAQVSYGTRPLTDEEKAALEDQCRPTEWSNPAIEPVCGAGQ